MESQITQTPKILRAHYFCAAVGCNSDHRKIGKYGFMTDIKFFPFPTEKKAPKIRKKWLDLLRRVDYKPKKHSRLCSRHFVEGRPTKEHPYPELFSYNNYKKPKHTRSTTSIQKMDEIRTEMSRRLKSRKLSKEYSSHDNVADFQSTAGLGGVISRASHPIVLYDGTRNRFLPVIKEIEVTTSCDDHSTEDTVDDATRYCSLHSAVVNNVLTEDHTYIYNPDIEIPEMSDGSTQTTLTMEGIAEMESVIKGYEAIFKFHFGRPLRKKKDDKIKRKPSKSKKT